MAGEKWLRVRPSRRGRGRDPRGFARVAGQLGVALLAGSGPGLNLKAQPLAVPNASFEAPSTAFVSTVVQAWQKQPKPSWYEESGGFLWDQLVGVFRNTPPGTADHIENCDGLQAAWLFAVPEVGCFQVLYQDPVPRTPPPVYTPGHAYELTVGVLGGGGNMAVGVTLELALFYEDAAGRAQTIALSVVTNRADLWGPPKRFRDFTVRTPVVRETDPWAGRSIGLRFLSTVSFELQGGYWDLDHVRLVALPEQPLRLGPPRLENGRLVVTVQGEPAAAVELLASDALHLPVSAWEPLERLANFTGSGAFSVEVLDAPSRFFAARLVRN